LQKQAPDNVVVIGVAPLVYDKIAGRMLARGAQGI
jgi:hypothetical protein